MFTLNSISLVNNMQLVSTWEVKFKWTWSLESMFTFDSFLHEWHATCLQLASTCQASLESNLIIGMRVYFHFDFMQLASTCQVKFELTWSSLACLLSTRFHAMNNMQLASICEVRFELTSSMNACLHSTWLHLRTTCN